MLRTVQALEGACLELDVGGEPLLEIPSRFWWSKRLADYCLTVLLRETIGGDSLASLPGRVRPPSGKLSGAGLGTHDGESFQPHRATSTAYDHAGRGLFAFTGHEHLSQPPRQMVAHADVKRAISKANDVGDWRRFAGQ